ncbi:hypothetical protein COLSTE_01387 [Collinsella stercoris DSM 13279]|uniref:Uncharacterized protein n=1 Tax=Collinsella stercoris DSM 13279 TaxID=445975 RepID=B6GBC8_9ACTN|nr:hypothetical protein COLSTE_01387 [Collinsella stercoris DSM 13279]
MTAPSGSVDTRRTRLGHKEIKRPHPAMRSYRFSSTEQPFKRLPWRIVVEIPLCRNAIPQNVRKRPRNSAPCFALTPPLQRRCFLHRQQHGSRAATTSAASCRRGQRASPRR